MRYMIVPSPSHPTFVCDTIEETLARVARLLEAGSVDVEVIDRKNGRTYRADELVKLSRSSRRVPMAKSATFQDPIFQDETKAREALEAVLWPHGPVCRHCG